MIVTTSWDDSFDECDARLIDLLDQYGVRSTLYVRADTLSAPRALPFLHGINPRHEIGAHSMTHPILTDLSDGRLVEEVAGAKAALECAFGLSVDVFAFPFGIRDTRVVEAVKAANYLGARITEGFNAELPTDRYAIRPTLQVYPHPVIAWPTLANARTLVLRNGYYAREIWRSRLRPSAYLSWTELAKATFDDALERNGVWHLWGHSWEVEKYDLWTQLKDVLKYVAFRDGTGYLTNGELCMLSVKT